MRVAFLGNFGVNYSSESDYLWTMREKLGYEVVPLQEGENGATAEEIEAVALESDCFFWVHTHGWRPRGKSMREVLGRLRAESIPTFSYHLDLWMGLDRQADLAKDEFWDIDRFFTVDKLMADYLNSHNGPKTSFVRPGVVQRDCYIAPVNPIYEFDVIFVGSRGYHHEWPYRPQLIDWLQANYGHRFAHWGGDGLGTIRSGDLNRLYASAKVVVGDTLCQGFDYPYYVSDRVYETVGRGGFLIHPYIKGMEEEFVDGQHLVLYKYGEFDDLKQKIDRYLVDHVDRDRIRLAGHQLVRDNYTYTQRLGQIFSEVFGSESDWSASP